MYYFDILQALTGIRYLIVGGLAVNLHGVPRVTQDGEKYPDLSAGSQ
ncbi:MAG: hypothetical protein ACAI44_23780 [Candidatus Sericytochromatia bacterium]